MFSTVSAASENRSRTRGWWLRNGWTGRPLNLLIGLLAGSSVALSLLSGAMLLRSRNIATDYAEPELATELDRKVAKILLWQDMMEIFSEAVGRKRPPVAMVMPPNAIGRSWPASPETGANAENNVDEQKQGNNIKKPEPENVIPQPDPDLTKREKLIADFLRFLSNQIGGFQLDLRDVSRRIAATEEGIRQLREKSWYDWCGAITALLGQLAGLLAAILTILKWLGSKPASPSVA